MSHPAPHPCRSLRSLARPLRFRFPPPSQTAVCSAPAHRVSAALLADTAPLPVLRSVASFLGRSARRLCFRLSLCSKGEIEAKGSCAARLSVGRFCDVLVSENLKLDEEEKNGRGFTVCAPLYAPPHFTCRTCFALSPAFRCRLLLRFAKYHRPFCVCRRPPRRRGSLPKTKEKHLPEGKCLSIVLSGCKSTQDPRRQEARLVWQGKK